jgi:hypothetical protein
LWEYLPNLLGAIVILVGGVLVTWIIARLVRTGLKKIGLGNRLGRWVGGGELARPGYGEKPISQIVFWVLIVFVLAGFFQALRLPVVSDPLSNLLQTVFGYIPRLLAAVGLVALAWVLAAGLRILIVSFLARTKLDERINKELLDPPGAAAEKKASGRVSPSRTLGDLAYWLVFLFFIPLVLDALGFRGLLAPVQQMLDAILVFLPNLFVAVLILTFGYFVAKIVSRIVTNLLQATGVNRFHLPKGETAEAGRLQPATLIGYVVFVLILVPIVIATLQTLHLESITRPAEEMLTKFLAALPNIFAAIALLTISFYVGRLLAEMAGDLLISTGFDGLVSRMGLTRGAGVGKKATATPTEGRSASRCLGQIVLVVVMLLSAEAALRLIGLQGLADLLNQALAFIGHLILGLIVFGTGLYLGALAARLIRGSNLSNADILAPLAQAAIVILMGAMGLEQMGIGSDIIRLAFGLTLGAAAVAAAIAFGIGSRDLARDVVTKYLGHWGKKGHDSSR